MKLFNRIRRLDASLEVQELQGESRPRAATAPNRRERLMNVAFAAVFLVVAIPMALQSGSEIEWSIALSTVVAYAIASGIPFEIGAGWTAPTQLIFVPMLFLLPPGTVPLFVAAGLVLGNLPATFRGEVHPCRLVPLLWFSWYSVGPAVVFISAGVTEPRLSDWPIYLVALIAQFVFDFVGSSVRERFALGVAPSVQIGAVAWVALVDTLLAPVGFAAALASLQTEWAVFLMIPLVGLLAVFAKERRARIEHAAELSQAYRGTALLLGDVVEADDEYTGQHSKGVVELALAVAERMRLDAAQRRRVEFGALLHDVGKVAIPKEIINKPAALTPEERAIINTHTIEGQRMLDRVGGVLGEVGVIVRASHEDYDGGGYPDGLAGPDIPIEARIVSCCDAFHAMITDRPYRKARSVEAAVQELRDFSGTQFDPDVVEALICVYEPEVAIVRTEQPAPPVVAASTSGLLHAG